MRRAAKLFKVSRTTLQRSLDDYYKNGVVEKKHHGAKPALTADEETFLVECILNFADAGASLSFDELRSLVDAITVGPQRLTYKKTHLKLTKNWRKGFLARHPEVDFMNVTVVSKDYMMTHEKVESVKNMYKEFNMLIDTHQLTGKDISAMDETAVSCGETDAAHRKVFGRKGAQAVRYVGRASHRATIVVGTRADGKLYTPMLIHESSAKPPKPPATHVEAWNSASNLPNTVHAATSTSFIDNYLYHSFYTKCMLPEQSTDRIHVSLQDGAGQHWNAATMLACRRDLHEGHGVEKGDQKPVLVFTYPENTSRYVAPLDNRACFGSFKRNYYARLFKQKGNVPALNMKKLAGASFAQTMRAANIKASFRNVGFVADKTTRLQGQAQVVARMEQELKAREWLDETSAVRGEVKTVFDGLLHPTGHQLLREGAPKQVRNPFGANTKRVGVVNGDANINGIKEKLEEIKKNVNKNK